MEMEMGRDFFMKQKRTLLEITHSGNKGQSLPNSWFHLSYSTDLYSEIIGVIHWIC